MKTVQFYQSRVVIHRSSLSYIKNVNTNLTNRKTFEPLTGILKKVSPYLTYRTSIRITSSKGSLDTRLQHLRGPVVLDRYTKYDRCRL